MPTIEVDTEISDVDECWEEEGEDQDQGRHQAVHGEGEELCVAELCWSQRWSTQSLEAMIILRMSE